MAENTQHTERLANKDKWNVQNNCSTWWTIDLPVEEDSNFV